MKQDNLVRERQQQEDLQRSTFVRIIGTGPGDPAYITPAALEAIRRAQIVVGGRRLLQSFARPGQKRYIIDKDLPGTVQFIKKQVKDQEVAVLVSGDPGFFSMARYLQKHIKGVQWEIIPGISSVQYMFARLRLPWQEVPFFSVHGRPVESLPDLVRTAPVVALLTGAGQSAQKVAACLSGHKINAPVSIGIDLSYPCERLVHTTLAALVEDSADYSNSVMVIFNEDAF